MSTGPGIRMDVCRRRDAVLDCVRWRHEHRDVLVAMLEARVPNALN